MTAGMQPEREYLTGGVLAGRATALLARACHSRSAGTVFVPALYCAEVVEAITCGGVEIRYYDVRPDLTPPVQELVRALPGGAATVIWSHPFGLWSPPPRLPSVRLIQDACVALRTFVARDWPLCGADLAIFSPRKEFGWPGGGVALGRDALALASTDEVDPEVTTRWRNLDAPAAAADGRAGTGFARAVLGDRLPPGRRDDVLGWLPVLHDRRDAVVADLRGRGIEAWYWRDPLPGLVDHAAPVAADLARRLLLVPVPPPGSPVYTLLDSLGLSDWPHDESPTPTDQTKWRSGKDDRQRSPTAARLARR